jgi:phage replication-related protein YjqB (UPF0714/DUF867 family)
MIEHHTSQIAAASAGEEHNLYLFEGIKLSGNYRNLHVTSHHFDDPQCLELIAQCDFVVAIHGCTGDDERIFIGGLDATLIALVAEQLAADGLTIQTADHKFPATDSQNICNRGRSRKGVQLELTDALRNSANMAKIAPAVRRVLSSAAGSYNASAFADDATLR